MLRRFLAALVVFGVVGWAGCSNKNTAANKPEVYDPALIPPKETTKAGPGSPQAQKVPN